jgi:polar amino acid transport system permease protein
VNLTDVIDVLTRGGRITIISTVTVGLIAIPVAFGVGTARATLRSRLLRVLMAIYVEVFRGTSAIVQLFWVFFVLPSIGIELSPFVAGVTVLGLNAGAYGSEIVRGALNAVPSGQSEAARSLNMSRWDEIRFILLPQAVPVTIPPFESLAIEWFKATSLLSLISINELTYEVNTMAINGRLELVPSFMLLMLVYLILSLPITQAGRLVDSLYGRGWRGKRRSQTPQPSKLVVR